LPAPRRRRDERFAELRRALLQQLGVEDDGIGEVVQAFSTSRKAERPGNRHELAARVSV
jgi:hypothetical protein